MLTGTMLAILDSSILNILVLPIMEEFQADLRTVEWVLTSYNLAFAVFLIGFGSLGDTVGRRHLYVWGQAVFVLGSGLAAVASEPWQLIAFRAMQGLGAAALALNALALIVDHFPEGERGSALGIWGAAAGLGGALGPAVGGMVAQTWGWRALFLLNLPVGLLVIGAAYVLLPADPPWRDQRFDIRGFVLLSAALLELSLALTGAPDLGGGWSNLIAGAGIGLATPALIRVSTESVGEARSGLGAGVYKTVNELGGVFGVVLLGALLEARIVANALQQIPNHFLPQELSLKVLTSLKAVESHALQKGLPLQELDGFHRALVEAVQRGFDQVFGVATLLAGIGILAGLLLPRRVGSQLQARSPKAPLDTTGPTSGQGRSRCV